MSSTTIYFIRDVAYLNKKLELYKFFFTNFTVKRLFQIADVKILNQKRIINMKMYNIIFNKKKRIGSTLKMC